MIRKKTTLIILFLVMTVALLLLAACVDFIPSDDIPGINANAVLDIEHDRLNFAVGMTVDSADIIAKCNCTLTDDEGNIVKVTKEHLTSGKVGYTKFDTSTAGSNRQVKVSYKENNYYIAYDVDSYSVDLWLEDEELYQTVTPVAYMTEDMQLACGINLSDYNYAMDAEVIRSNTEKGLRFAGWSDSEGNIQTGAMVLQRPTHGNQRKVDLYAHFLSEEEFANFNIEYDLRNRKVFKGYTGSKVTTLVIPESVTYIDLTSFVLAEDATPNFSYVSIPSTADLGTPEMRLSTPYLLGFSVSEDNANYRSFNGGIFDKDYKICYYVPSGITEIELPETLVTIEKYAMADSGVSSIELPENVTTLERFCFAYSALESLGGWKNDVAVMDGVFVGTALEKGFDVDEGALYYCISEEEQLYGLSRIVDKTITTFKLKEGTISIAGNAFNGCAALESVDLGTKLQHVGESAFANCTSLREVIFPASLKTMGSQVFYGCTSLNKVVLPDISAVSDDKVVEHAIPSGLFRNCTSLEEVTLSDDTTSIGNQVFYNCSSLKNFKLPDSLISIGSTAFYASGITSVTFPKEVKTLGGHAFDHSALAEVDFSQNENIKALSDYCFAYTKLTEIAIPERITEVSDHCFYYCTAMTSVDLTPVVTIKDYAFGYCTALTDITFGDVLTTISTRAFTSCKALTSVTLPDSVETVLGYAFASCTALTEFSFGPNVATFGNFTFLDETDDFDAAAPVFYTSTALEKITVDENNPNFKSVDGILYGSFVGGREFPQYSILWYVPSAYDAEELTLEESTEVVLPYSIYSQANITKVVLNHGLKNIGKAAFYLSAQLTDLEIPQTVTHLGASILLSCGVVENFSINEGNETYYCDGQLIYTREGNELIMYLEFSGDVEIAEGTKSIAMGVFMNKTILTSVKIPDSVETVGVKAFKGCTKLQTLEIGSGLKEFGSEAFAGLSSLENVTVHPDNKFFKAVDGLLYSKSGDKLLLVPACCGMTEFKIAPGVEEIGDWAVSYNKTLEKVVLPVGVKVVGAYAFYECRALAFFQDSEALAKIGTYAFAFATSINPKDTTENRCCDTLKTVLLHGGITSIGDSAFYGQYGIENLFLNMTIEEATKLMSIVSKNMVYLTTGAPDNKDVGQNHNHIVRSIYSGQAPEISYNGYSWWHYVNGVPTIWDTNQSEAK